MKKIALTIFIFLECFVLFYSQYVTAKNYVKYKAPNLIELPVDLILTTSKEISIDESSDVIPKGTKVLPSAICDEYVFVKYISSDRAIVVKAHVDDFMEKDRIGQLWNGYLQDKEEQDRLLIQRGIIRGVAHSVCWLVIGLLASFIIYKKQLYKLLFAGHVIVLFVICFTGISFISS